MAAAAEQHDRGSPYCGTARSFEPQSINLREIEILCDGDCQLGPLVDAHDRADVLRVLKDLRRRITGSAENRRVLWADGLACDLVALVENRKRDVTGKSVSGLCTYR